MIAVVIEDFLTGGHMGYSEGYAFNYVLESRFIVVRFYVDVFKVLIGFMIKEI